MKIILRYRTCEIIFDETDPYYAGKILVLEGEGIDESSFCIHKHLDIFWSVTSSENPKHSTGVIVEDFERENLLSYVIEKAKENGYTLTLW